MLPVSAECDIGVILILLLIPNLKDVGPPSDAISIYVVNVIHIRYITPHSGPQTFLVSIEITKSDTDFRSYLSRPIDELELTDQK